MNSPFRIIASLRRRAEEAERPGPPCARIFVYQRNLERMSLAVAELGDELLATLEHEITAAFLEDRRSQTGRPKAKHELN